MFRASFIPTLSCWGCGGFCGSICEIWVHTHWFPSRHADAYGETKEQITVEKSHKVSFLFNFSNPLWSSARTGSCSYEWREEGELGWTRNWAESWSQMAEVTTGNSTQKIQIINQSLLREVKERQKGRKRLHTGLKAQTENPHVLDFWQWIQFLFPLFQYKLVTSGQSVGLVVTRYIHSAPQSLFFFPLGCSWEGWPTRLPFNPVCWMSLCSFHTETDFMSFFLSPAQNHIKKSESW